MRSIAAGRLIGAWTEAELAPGVIRSLVVEGRGEDLLVQSDRDRDTLVEAVQEGVAQRGGGSNGALDPLREVDMDQTVLLVTVRAGCGQSVDVLITPGVSPTPLWGRVITSAEDALCPESPEMVEVWAVDRDLASQEGFRHVVAVGG